MEPFYRCCCSDKWSESKVYYVSRFVGWQVPNKVLIRGLKWAIREGRKVGHNTRSSCKQLSSCVCAQELFNKCGVTWEVFQEGELVLKESYRKLGKVCIHKTEM